MCLPPLKRFHTRLEYSGADTTHEEWCFSLKGFSATGFDETNNQWDLGPYLAPSAIDFLRRLKADFPSQHTGTITLGP